MSKNILLTGGAGYIGSHTALEMLEAGYEVFVIDNFSNSTIESLNRVEKITGKKIHFTQIDLMNYVDLENFFAEYAIDTVVHFAALKSVGESVEKPLMYYENNITGSLNLFKAMNQAHVKKIVFSSSATVYGDPEKLPITEDSPIQPTNPYGYTKSMMEQILIDCSAAYAFDVVLLRYFNPVGAHKSGMIGEDPEFPNNLLPFVMQVAVGKREKITVFGDDWPTVDGTGVRDYIHIVDLARGHIKSVEKLKNNKGVHIYNLGTGRGYSVLEMVAASSKASGRDIKVEIGPRRNGDVAEVIADPAKANKDLGWKAEFGLDEMVNSAWKWQELNPEGFSK